MYSLNDSPLSDIVNTLDQEKYSIKKDEGADGSEAYILTDATTGVRIRVQAGGDPAPLNICGEDTDTDDWGELSTDPETAINEITDFAAWLAARTER